MNFFARRRNAGEVCAEREFDVRDDHQPGDQVPEGRGQSLGDE